jgi:5'-nucleotidase
VKVSKDTYKPVVCLTVPRNPGKASSWTKLTGTASDTGVGVDRIQAKLIEQRSGRWYYYTGSSWVKAGSERDAEAKATAISATPSATGAWTVTLQGVTDGTLKVTYWAEDKVGNTSRAQVHTQHLIR